MNLHDDKMNNKIVSWCCWQQWSNHEAITMSWSSQWHVSILHMISTTFTPLNIVIYCCVMCFDNYFYYNTSWINYLLNSRRQTEAKWKTKCISYDNLFVISIEFSRGSHLSHALQLCFCKTIIPFFSLWKDNRSNHNWILKKRG